MVRSLTLHDLQHSLYFMIKTFFWFFVCLVRRLLMKGVNPDSTNEDGLTALHQVRYFKYSLIL